MVAVVMCAACDEETGAGVGGGAASSGSGGSPAVDDAGPDVAAEACAPAPVDCKTSVGTFHGCDGFEHSGYALTYGDGGACVGYDPLAVGCCPAGTPCTVTPDGADPLPGVCL